VHLALLTRSAPAARAAQEVRGAKREAKAAKNAHEQPLYAALGRDCAKADGAPAKKLTRPELASIWDGLSRQQRGDTTTQAFKAMKRDEQADTLVAILTKQQASSSSTTSTTSTTTSSSSSAEPEPSLAEDEELPQAANLTGDEDADSSSSAEEEEEDEDGDSAMRPAPRAAPLWQRPVRTRRTRSMDDVYVRLSDLDDEAMSESEEDEE
jgi:hypothetical protein